MCARAADMNAASKEKELQRLLEVLRIKAETYVLVWDHLATMLEGGETEKMTNNHNEESTPEMMGQGEVKS